jgi:hypothetical protein
MRNILCCLPSARAFGVRVKTGKEKQSKTKQKEKENINKKISKNNKPSVTTPVAAKA